MTKKQPSISIVLPVYNERLRIAQGIQSALRLRTRWQGDVEIIVVDDGSDDGTKEVLTEDLMAQLRFIRIPHQGKGAAVKEGILAATGERIIFSDIDWSVPVEQVLEMLVVDSAIVIASREIKGARRIAEPPERHLLGKMFNRWVQWMLLSGYEDTQCGCKVFQRDIATQIFTKVQEKGWAFDVEVLVLAHVLGVIVTEFPVSWQYQPSSKIVIVRDGIQMGSAILRIKKRLLRGEYQF